MEQERERAHHLDGVDDESSIVEFIARGPSREPVVPFIPEGLLSDSSTVLVLPGLRKIVAPEAVSSSAKSK